MISIICSILTILTVLGFFRPSFSFTLPFFYRSGLHLSCYELELKGERENPSAPLKQLSIRFDCEKANPEELSELLFEVGTLSVSVEVETEKNVLNDETKWSDLGKQRSWATAVLKAFFPSSFDSRRLASIIETTYPDLNFNIEVADLETKDWVSEVQSNWAPQVIGDLTIRFPWHNESLSSTSKELVLEGGAAFGTGDHPTTRLCCRWLNKIIKIRLKSQIADTLVLDYGCGSGILGLAALIYGASEAVGVDIDRDSLLSARNNCNMNKLEMPLYLAYEDDDCAGMEEQSVAMNNLRGMASPDSFSFLPLYELDNKKFDILVANILAPILINLVESLANRLEPGGLIGLSGIISPQSNTVLETFDKYFDNMKVEETESDWVLITGIKR